MAIAMWWISLSLIVVAAAVAGVAWWRSRKRGQSGAIPVANSRRLTKLPAYRRALVRYSSLMTAVGVVLAILLAVTSVAAGRWVYQRVESPEKFNRDIVLCLDISGSMVDYDVEVLDRYLEMLPGFDGERMSLMLWDATAVQLFPLTDDYAFVETQLQQVRDEMESASGGSNIEYSFAQGTQGAAGASLVGDGLAERGLDVRLHHIRNQGLLIFEIIPGTHGSKNFSVYDHLGAYIIGRLQKDGIHQDRRPDPGCLCLHDLGPSHLKTILCDKGIQCHIL